MAHSNGPFDEKQLQILDVQLVDVLAQLEALLRHSHSIQRALLRLRSIAPPLSPTDGHAVLTEAQREAHAMREECAMLTQIADDLATGVDRTLGVTRSDRRSGQDRRVAPLQVQAHGAGDE